MEMPLRETGEAKDLMIGLVRNEFERLARSALTQSAPTTDSEALCKEVLDAIPAQEPLNENLAVCLSNLKSDFHRYGILLISKNGQTMAQYFMAFEKDRTAGQKWETLEAKLRANGAGLLKKAAAMPGRAILVGVDEKGELIIILQGEENIVCDTMLYRRWLRGGYG